MTFFEPNQKRRPRAGGWLFLGLFVITFGSLMALPTGYVIERPGATFNVMATVDGVPVISASSVETYASESKFDVLTVSLIGNRENTPSWLQILAAWVDPSQKVLPVDEVFPADLTTDQIQAESAAQMEVSQQDAIAAALTHLDYEVERKLYISEVFEGTPASGLLVAGDFVTGVDGQLPADILNLRALIAAGAGKEILMSVEREGKPLDFQLVPEQSNGNWVVGVGVSYVYDFPVEIDLQLGDVGGPSGGLIFAMGIIDTLTPDSLAGELHVAGTGTINADGQVGAIGGVDLKMLAAKNAGANLFIGPRENCSEILGQIPDGLSVAVVKTLSDAIAVSEEFQSSGVIATEFQCTNK